MKKFIISFFLLVFFIKFSSAQDKIYKKTGEIIKVKVSEIGTEEIKYYNYGDSLSPLYTMDKAKVIKVVYQNGKVEVYGGYSSLRDPELYSSQLKKAIKIDLFAPQLGYFSVEYEKNLKPGKSIAFSAAIIGLGRNIGIGQALEGSVYVNKNRGAAGLALSGGYKFIKLPNFVSSNTKYSNIMQGAYAKPTFTIGDYSENVIGYNSALSRRNIIYSSLLIELGKQWVFGDKLVFDTFGGIGYMVDNHKTINGYVSDISNNFTGTRAGSGAGIGFSFGLKVGLLFK